MSQEEKELTAVEIERMMRERRISELEEAEKNSEKEASESKDKNIKTGKSLGIQSLKKGNKGKALVLIAFIIMALGSIVYFFPSLLRSMYSEEKPKPAETVTTGGVNRLTGLNDDADPFNGDDSRSVSQGGDSTTTGNSSGAGRTANNAAPVTFSRALDGYVSSSGTSQATQSNDSNSYSNQKEKSGDATTKNELSVEKNDTPDSEKIRILPYDPNLFIPENTEIPCSLDRKFVSDLAGRMTCTVNEDIYSANHNVKLIDKGTSATLVYKSAYTPKHGQGRVFIIATKLRTRTQPFIEIPLIDTSAAGALGESGVDGWIDNHFADRFVGAAMLGIIPDVAQWASGAVKNNKDSQTDYTENSRQAFADIAKEAFANSVNIPPTMYKNQGEIITLITGRDLDFSSIYKLRMKK